MAGARKSFAFTVLVAALAVAAISGVFDEIALSRVICCPFGDHIVFYLPSRAGEWRWGSDEVRAEVVDDVVVDDDDECLQVIEDLADSNYAFMLGEKFGHGGLERRRRAARDRNGGFVPAAEGSALAETDDEFLRATICIQNARWMARVFVGEQRVEAGLGEVHATPGTWRQSLADAPAEEHAQTKVTFVSFPPITPVAADGDPEFYYYGHAFVIQQIPGPRFRVYASYNNHYRVVDWLRAWNVNNAQAGGCLLTLDEMLAHLDDMDRFINIINSELRWTREANVLHARLFAVFKLDDMERAAGYPAGTMEEIALKPSRYHADGKYAVYAETMTYAADECAKNAAELRRRLYGSMVSTREMIAEPPPAMERILGGRLGAAKAVAYNCSSTKWVSRDCPSTVTSTGDDVSARRPCAGRRHAKT